MAVHIRSFSNKENFAAIVLSFAMLKLCCLKQINSVFCENGNSDCIAALSVQKYTAYFFEFAMAASDSQL